MKLFFLSLGVLLSFAHFGQTWEHYQTSDSEAYLALPEGTPIGLVIREFSTAIDTSVQSKFQFTPLALEAGFAVLFSRTSQYYPDLYLDHSGPARLDTLVHRVFKAHPEMDKSQLFIGGISASGTRALKYTEYCGKGLSTFNHQVKAVFAVDPPLDLERFYNSSQKIIERNHPLGNTWESNLIIETFNRELGPLDENRDAYVEASVYCYSESDSVQIAPYLNSSILLIHEPDAQWWLDNRMECVFESNMTDVTAFYAALQGQEHPAAQIIHTQNKGFDDEGKRKPHSWTIVDEAGLVDWLVKKVNE